MDLLQIEQRLHHAADVILVDARLIRRVIKQHRRASLVVGHNRCYALSKAALLGIASGAELGLDPASGNEDVILVARPSLRDMRRRSPDEILTRILRAAFHARVHLALEAKAAAGLLSEAAILQRIEYIGRTEFEEIRATLTHDDRILHPATELDVYIEFAATYFELREFAPALIVVAFPGLTERERVDDILSVDIDVDALLLRSDHDRSRPSMRPSARPPGSGQTIPPASVRIVRPVHERTHARLLADAARAGARSNHVRALLLAARAALTSDPARREQAESLVDSNAEALARRVRSPLWIGPSAPDENRRWIVALRTVALRAAQDRGTRLTPEAKVLFALERAAIAQERPGRAVDVPSWILSAGQRPIVRPRGDAAELDAARHMSAAVRWAHRARIAAADRASFNALLAMASRRSEHNIRQTLRPRIRAVLDQVGLYARSDAQRLAQDKLVEELLDRILTRGFISLPQLRDAISRNQLKLGDLSRARELLEGDSLLRADAKLSEALDGIYRRGDVYLRMLQKLSSIQFGTRIGRVVSLYIVLPLVAAFTLIEGTRHIIGPVVEKLGFAPMKAPGLPTLLFTATLVLALLHSVPFRGFARQVIDIVGTILAWVFFRIPRAVLTRPALKRLLAKPAVRLLARRLLLPGILAAVVYWATPFTRGQIDLPLVAALATFLVASTIMGSRFGWWFEGYLIEQVAPTWQVLSRQWLPGLLRLISRVFSVLMDGLERAIYRIEDALQFRRSTSLPLLVIAAAAGTLWAALAYVIRLYMTLLVEPEINPLKHFPVVTVAHKVMLPFLPQLVSILEAPLGVFGPIVGDTIAWVTVFLLPSVFGFLAWELKENYQLYRAGLPQTIQSARVGPNGETMRGLLVPGLHSGTLPKVYERLRSAVVQRDERATGARKATASAAVGDDPAYAQFREGIKEVEHALYRFVERELLPPIAASPRWKMHYVEVVRIDLTSNRIRIQLKCPAASPEPCELTLEQLGGMIVAGMPKPGFLAELSRDQASLFENALSVFYHRAEVDVVREQLEAELGEGVHYDVTEEGLVVWPGASYQTELVYPLTVRSPRALLPVVHGAPPVRVPRVLDSRRVLFTQQPIAWLAWENAWTTAGVESEPVVRLTLGSSLLARLGAANARASAARLQLKSIAGVE